MTSRADVYEIINSERDYQDQHRIHDPLQPAFTTGDYITMMRVYVDKLAPAWAFNLGVAPEDVLHNMRKIAAIAVQCMEVHGAPSRSVEGLGQWGKRSMAEQAASKTSKFDVGKKVDDETD